jgi:hypothetical protein
MPAIERDMVSEVERTRADVDALFRNYDLKVAVQQGLSRRMGMRWPSDMQARSSLVYETLAKLRDTAYETFGKNELSAADPVSRDKMLMAVIRSEFEGVPLPKRQETNLDDEIIEAELIPDEAPPAVQEAMNEVLNAEVWAQWRSRPLDAASLGGFTNAFVQKLGKALRYLSDEQLVSAQETFGSILYGMYEAAYRAPLPASTEVSPEDRSYLRQELSRSLPSYWSSALDSARKFSFIE